MPTEIEKIRERILNTVDASKIYLFGSYARGTQTENSDYDFFVVIPDGKMRPMEAMQKIYLSLASHPMPIPVDVLASYESEFDKRKKEKISLENTILNEGVLIYERGFKRNRNSRKRGQDRFFACGKNL